MFNIKHKLLSGWSKYLKSDKFGPDIFRQLLVGLLHHRGDAIIRNQGRLQQELSADDYSGGVHPCG